MCKNCKLAKKVKKLEVELAELKAKVDGHVGHYIYPYPLTTSYPYTFGTTYPNTTITYTNDVFNGGTSEG